jgi:hypothetical protein
MKTREYFIKETNRIKAELKENIQKLLYSKVKIGHLWYNDDESNTIEFLNEITCIDENDKIDYIYVGEEISIYPKGNASCSLHLSDIENIHSLLLLQHIAEKSV